MALAGRPQRKLPSKYRKRPEADFGALRHTSAMLKSGLAKTSKANTSGFSLVELLVVIAIIAILSALLLPALARAKQKGKQMTELNAGRQLFLAWQMYSSDNDDAILPGYIFPNGPVAYDDHNQLIDPSLPDGARYPW